MTSQPRALDQPLRDRPHGLAGLRRGRGALLGQPGDREPAERHAEDVGVLRGQHAVVADGVAPPPQPAAHHLLAQQPRAERPHAEDVRHRVAVPALGEHRHGHDAADVLAELALLADRVQHLAHQVFVGQVLGVAAGEPPRYSALKSSIWCAASFLKSSDMLSPDSSCRLSTRIVFGRCSQRWSFTLLNSGSAPGATTGSPSGCWCSVLVPGDVVEDRLADVGVVADDDEHGRRAAVGPRLLVGLPLRELPGVVAVQALQRPFEQPRQQRRLVGVLRPAAHVLQPVADVHPQVAVLRVVAGHRVVGDGHARNLDDAALDGVHEREVGHDPREQRHFRPALEQLRLLAGLRLLRLFGRRNGHQMLAAPPPLTDRTCRHAPLVELVVLPRRQEGRVQYWIVPDRQRRPSVRGSLGDLIPDLQSKREKIRRPPSLRSGSRLAAAPGPPSPR